MHNLKIVFDDDYLAVVDKPSGLVVIPTPRKESRTLTSIVNQQFRNRDNEVHLHPCHRLDRDTSGLVIYAKGKANQQLVMEEFRGQRVKKKYIALVHGKLKLPEGVIKNYIEDVPIGVKKHHHERKLAITRYKVASEKKDYSVVEVYPITGRTNQIRIHFQQMGNPLLGERKYAFPRDFPLKFKRVALHACQLDFTHPVSRKQLTLTSSLPDDMKDFMQRR